MASVGYATLSVIPSAKGFGAALSNDVDPQMHRSGLSAGKLLAGGLLAGTAVIAAGIGAILKTGFDEAKDASAGIAQLAAGIKSTGNAAGTTVDGMTALAGSIQSMSGQTDDSIVAAEQLLLTFTNIKNSGANKIFDQATLAAADMAAKMGGDASSQAILLGKALNDPVKGITALTRVGVSFTQGQKDSIAAMVKHGDTAGAQKIILKELQTEFGGAAAAAGNSLPGQLARGQRAFEDMSQAVAENLIPIVMPAVLKVTEAITAASPAIAEFARKFSVELKDGITAAQPFLNAVGTVAKDIGTWITGIAIPAVQNFIQEFKDGEGPGGKLRDILKEIKDKGLDPLASFITVTAIPALQGIADWVTGPGAKGLGDFTTWLKDNKENIGYLAIAITTVLFPVFLDMGVKAVASAATQVGAWISSSAASTTSAATQFASHYVVVAGWIAHAAAATATAITNGIVWAQLYTEAALGAAKTIVSHVLVAVGGWGVQAAAAVTAGLTTAGVWVSMALQSGLGAAKAIGGLILVAGGWIATAATAMASGVMMAAAWLIGLGPVGWIIAAVIAVGAAFVLLYTKVGWFRDGVNAAWAAIKTAFAFVVDWLVGAWNNYVYGLSKIPEAIGAIFKGIGNFITAPFRAAFNEVARLWNNTVGGFAIQVPDWVPGIGGRTFSLPKIPSLADGATIMPSSGGTLVRVAEAGRAESVVDTGKMNQLLDLALRPAAASGMIRLHPDDIAAIGSVILNGAASTARTVYGVESVSLSVAQRRNSK
ncbi:MAG: hypothetical protein ACOH10_08010 [Rhodoglobus sp.]